jgi:hypothetical protein
VYVLSHLAYHLQEDAVMSKMMTKYRTPDEFADAMVDHEARAHIQAWNDMLDAIERRQGKKLTASQCGKMLFNLRYRGVLMKAAMDRDNGLQIGEDNRIEPNRRNVAALAKIVSQNTMLEIE